MPVLDANFLILLGQDDSSAVAALGKLRNQRMLVPPSAAAEYLTGVEDPAGGLEALKAGFEMARDLDAWILAAARLRREARAKGAKTIRVPDLWIAAWAVVYGTYVVTADAGHLRSFGVPVWDFRREARPPA